MHYVLESDWRGVQLLRSRLCTDRDNCGQNPNINGPRYERVTTGTYLWVSYLLLVHPQTDESGKVTVTYSYGTYLWWVLYLLEANSHMLWYRPKVLFVSFSRYIPMWLKISKVSIEHAGKLTLSMSTSI